MTAQDVFTKHERDSISGPAPKGSFIQAILVGDFARRCYFKIENTVTSINCFDACVKTTLRFIHTRNVDIVSDTISIETLPYFQIATAGDSNNM